MIAKRVELYGDKLNVKQKIIILSVLQMVGEDGVLDINLFEYLRGLRIRSVKTFSHLMDGIRDQILIVYKEDEKCLTRWFDDYIFSRELCRIKIRLSSDLVPPYRRMAWQALLSQR